MVREEMFVDRRPVAGFTGAVNWVGGRMRAIGLSLIFILALSISIIAICSCRLSAGLFWVNEFVFVRPGNIRSGRMTFPGTVKLGGGCACGGGKVTIGGIAIEPDEGTRFGGVDCFGAWTSFSASSTADFSAGSSSSKVASRWIFSAPLWWA